MTRVTKPVKRLRALSATRSAQFWCGRESFGMCREIGPIDRRWSVGAGCPESGRNRSSGVRCRPRPRAAKRPGQSDNAARELILRRVCGIVRLHRSRTRIQNWSPSWQCNTQVLSPPDDTRRNGLSVLALGLATQETSFVMSPRGRVIVITGAMAAGKSTVAELLARRLPRSVHIHGDIFRTMIVNGRADMTPNPSPARRHNCTCATTWRR